MKVMRHAVGLQTIIDEDEPSTSGSSRLTLRETGPIYRTDSPAGHRALGDYSAKKSILAPLKYKVKLSLCLIN
jgi:hypothetical protein